MSFAPENHSLSERDISVLRSVSQHRFLSARQIEALHFDCHATQGAGARVARRVLARLTEERLLKRLERRVGGVRAGSASYVYALGPSGARVLGESKRTTEPSELFLDHTLAIGETRVLIHNAARAGTLEVSEVEIEPACWRRFIGTSGARDIVRPDLYVVTTAGHYEDAWFIEVDRGSESPAAISHKCHAYERYWRSGQEQSRHGSFPRVVWSAPNDKRATRIERVISSARNLNSELFRVTVQNDLVQLLAEGAA